MKSPADRRDGDRELGELVGRLAGEEDMDRATRARLLGRLGQAVRTGARRHARRRGGRARWLSEILLNEVVPRLQIRDHETLRRHHGGLSGEALADSLVRVAGRATAAVGAAGGALAAVEFVAPPLLLNVPAQLAAEALAVAAIEIKLIAELHEVYGVQVMGTPAQRARAFAMSWAARRGIDPLRPGSFSTALGSAAKLTLRTQMLRTFSRHMTTLGPFLSGMVAGGMLNHHVTRRLAEIVREDLRGKSRPMPGHYTSLR